MITLKTLMLALSLWLAPMAVGFNEMQRAPDTAVVRSSWSAVDTIHPQSPGVHTGLFL
jgi:hypothetical protein